MEFNVGVAAAVVVLILIGTAYLFMDPFPIDDAEEDIPPPEARIEASDMSLMVGGTVDLGACDTCGDIVEFRWKFGDGRSASGANVSVTYDEVGRYRVMLTVVDAEERTASDTIYVQVHIESWQNGTVDQGEPADSYDIEVLYEDDGGSHEQRSQGIYIYLTYIGERDVGAENNLTMSLRDPNDEVIRGTPDEWGETGEGSEKYALIIIAYQETAGRGGEWELTIEHESGGSPLDSEVDYQTQIIVYY